MKPRAFCELPAGLASVSLRLHGGAHCRPPISRMGNKAGYSAVILAALGLRSGEGAGAYVWAESDPDVRALLRAYPDPAMLRRIADIIRGWKDEEPRALWERLRAERKARNAQATHDVAETASWIYVHNVSHLQTPGPDGMRGFVHPEEGGRYGAGREETANRCHRLAEYASIVASNRLIHVAGPDLRNTGAGGTTFGGEAFATPAAEVASGFERVAGMVVEHRWSFSQKGPQFGYGGPGTNPGAFAGRDESIGCDATAIGLDRLASRWPPVAVLATLPDAAELSAMLGTPGDLDGVVVYADPDYRATTGYLSTCRDLIPDLARGWDAAGAVVCISEAEPLPELTGWHACEITAGRRGQKRTFSKQQAEWLTMNREPAHRVATQVSMFGGAP